MMLEVDSMQSVVTSQNSALMSNNLLKPDCYWIVDANHQIRAIPERTQRELRRGHILKRLYRNEEFDD